jgi:hypothetical protein
MGEGRRKGARSIGSRREGEEERRAVEILPFEHLLS